MSGYIFLLDYANTAHSLQVSLSPFTFSLQQVQTCVWDVSSPFKIVLGNASKVNAEETAKVYTCFVHVHETVFSVPVNISLHTQSLKAHLCHVPQGFTLTAVTHGLCQSVR